MPVAVEFSTIIEMFCNVTTKYADSSRPSLIHKIENKWIPLTFFEVSDMVELTTAGLATIGVQRGDRVAIISENRPEWVLCDMAIAALGAISVPLYPTLTSPQIEEIFLDADVSFACVSNVAQFRKIYSLLNKINSLRSIVVFTDKELPDDENVIPLVRVLTNGEKFLADNSYFVKERVREISPEDLLTIIYTSGTTGTPKGVQLTHKNIVENIKGSVAVLPISDTDTFLSFLPLCHTFERMGGYYTAMSCGASIAYAESIESVRNDLKEIHPTIMTAVPRFFERVYNRIIKNIAASSPLKQKLFWKSIAIGREYMKAKNNGNVSFLLKKKHALAEKLVFQKIKENTGGKIRFFVSGGGALAKELGEFFEAIGIVIIEGYGLTESSPVLSVNRVEKYKFGTVGFPIPNVELFIAEDGEILARGPNIMRGYWNDDVTTKKVISEDGWLHTGDIGEFDEEGFLKITDRKKNIFVTSGGKNIAPQPIENRFLRSKFIDQFVLIGDSRMYLSALIIPDFEILEELATALQILYRTTTELVQHKEIRNFYWNEIQQLQKNVPNFERVRKFVLLDHALSIESGEMTPTLKIRRKIIEEKYRTLIEQMYETSH
jgi:long-chain acyl-CoA synthetase